MTPRERAILDRLSDVARDAEPPALDPDQARRMASDAVSRATEEKPRERRHRTWLVAAAGVAAAAAVGLAVGLGWPADDPAPRAASETTRLELPTGDAVTASAGARFRIESIEDAERRIRLDDGAMLFDVARLGEGQAFEVVTPHLTARVLGTVFSVEARGDRSTVRVFEGRVLVEEEGRRRVLGAEEALTSSGGVQQVEDDGPLVEHGRTAARARAGDAPHAERTGDGDGPDRTAVDDADTPGRQAGADAETEPRAGDDLPRERVRERAPAAEEARAWIASGDADRALDAAREALRDDPTAAEWRMIEADALRALGRFEAAVSVYERAAVDLGGVRAAQAGYLAARIHQGRLDDARRALAALDLVGADEPGAPLEERATALRARILMAQGRREQAREVARRYLDRFPAGGMTDWMEAVLEPAPEPTPPSTPE